jgi:UDP-glucose 4-epimerase
MRILVTGSSGTIGTRLMETLLAEGHDVLGADRVENKWQPALQKRTIVTDLRNKEELELLPSDVDIVIHLAANARVYDLVEDPVRALDNVTTLFHTLEFCRTHKIPRFVFASSRECYGNVRLDRYTEDMVRIENCESPYTASKLAGEAFAVAYGRCYGIGAVVLRFSNVYGMYDDSNRVIPLWIRQAQAREELTIFGKEKNLDFTYIDDTVNGIIRVATKFDAVAGQTINIASGKGTSLLACAEAIKQLTGSDVSISFAPPRTGEVTHYTADITRARELLGYEPQVPFEEGIKKTVEWYGEHS